ncbi:MAG TPA: RAMP superfamily CRISPR-associated protein [Dehalococcoidia bacterium]|nr:RAMP superfamily CRISPR-associated protein [Dehalococcoidia bacterium]
MRPRSATPKPFFFLPLKKQPRKSEPPHHDRFIGYTGRLELSLEVISDYLYVGSGQIELANIAGREQAYYSFVRRSGEPIIPGSAVKGAVRSVVEAISNSCVKQSMHSEQIPRQHSPCREISFLCPACRIFGTTDHRGRVHFSDAVPAGQVGTEVIKVADLWPPRRSQGRKFYSSGPFRRLDLTPAKNFRFIEAVPKGSTFSLALHFENMQVDELGLLLRALGFERTPDDPPRLLRAFPLKLGGAKPRCLGAAQFTPHRLILISGGPNIIDDLIAGGRAMPAEETLTKWLADSTLVDGEAWELFRREAIRVRDICPPELY